MSSFNLNSIKKKLNKIEEIYLKNSENPFITSAVAFQQIDKDKNPEKGFKKMEDFQSLLKNWVEKKKIKDFKWNYVPICRVTGSFGNYWTLFSYLMSMNNVEKIKNKPNLILKPKQKLTNSELFKYFLPFLNVIEDEKLFYQSEFLGKIPKVPLEITIPFKKKYYPFFAATNFLNQFMKEKKNNKFDFFKIRDNDLEKGKLILKKIGVPDNSWYVTLHVRESPGNELFNAVPSTYVKAIKAIVSRGGYVIRVGDKNMTPLPKIKGLIDYPFTKFKSEFFDIFLAATCKFCIGTSSGYWTVATFFKKPILLTNYLPFLDYYALDDNCMFLPKKLIDKEKKKIIDIFDLFKFPLGSLSTNIQLDQNKIEYLDNSEDEIYNSTIDMLDFFEKKVDPMNFYLLIKN